MKEGNEDADHNDFLIPTKKGSRGDLQIIPP